MAVVTVTIIKGRDSQTKNRLIARLTDAIVDTIGAEPRQVRVIINEVEDGNYAVAGKPVHIVHSSTPKA